MEKSEDVGDVIYDITWRYHEGRLNSAFKAYYSGKLSKEKKLKVYKKMDKRIRKLGKLLKKSGGYSTSGAKKYLTDLVAEKGSHWIEYWKKK